MKNLLKLLCICLFTLTTLSFTSCKKDELVKIEGCNTIVYKGETYDHIGCFPGVASFNLTATQNGKTVSFHIICKDGCVEDATVI